MTINFSATQTTELKPRIVVIGVGGAGGNAVNNMIACGLEGVDFIVANTDAQALALSKAERRIQLGPNITQGLGCGARPDMGRAAAEEAMGQIEDQMTGAHMAFITAGMGGGTGTGAAPVIASILREKGILSVGVVTKPFSFEGSQRMACAQQGIEELQNFVDTLIVIPNQNLFRIANEKTTMADAFSMADNVLHSGVRGVTDLMVQPGLINLDFSDVRTVMAEMGKAMMGTGEAEGEKRALEAAESAISNPLLDDVSMKGAKGVLINITGGMDLTLYEVDEAANRVREEVDPDANILVGSALDDKLNGLIRVSVVATGIDVGAESVRPSTAKPRLAAVAGQVLGEAKLDDEHNNEFRGPLISKDDRVSGIMPEEDRISLSEDNLLDSSREINTKVNSEPDLLDLSVAEQVPPPKPIEPEPTLENLPRKIEIDNETSFIAPRPERPQATHIELEMPAPMAEAEVINASSSTSPKKGLGQWLFGRRNTVADGLIGNGADKNPPSNKQNHGGVKPPNTSILREQLVSPEEDLLEIPSFLRRQAN